MFTVTSTRPRLRRDVIRFLMDGSSEPSSEPTRRWISRKRLLTVFRSTETEKSSPATIPLPYPVIDFMVLKMCFVLCSLYFVRYQISRQNKVQSTKYKAQISLNLALQILPRPQIEARKACDIVRP